MLAFALTGGLYGLGWWRLRGARSLPAWRAWAFGAGLLSLAVALLSPISVFSELLFSLHMVQHLLLVLVAAPLLLLGAPIVPMLWGLPPSWRRNVGQLLVPHHPLQRAFHWLTHPLIATALFLIVLTVWHIPAFYDMAQGRTAIHDFEHISFFVTALLYWWPLIHPMGGPAPIGYGAGIFYTVPPLLQSNVLGALITLAERPLYLSYQNVPRIWGLSVLQDQQLAGLIMWVPGGMFWAIPLFASLILFARQEERNAIS